MLEYSIDYSSILPTWTFEHAVWIAIPLTSKLGRSSMTSHYYRFEKGGNIYHGPEQWDALQADILIRILQ